MKIKPDTIKKLAKKHNINIISTVMFRYKSYINHMEACPLGIIVYDRLSKNDKETLKNMPQLHSSRIIGSIADKIYGYDYVMGFMKGFDGKILDLTKTLDGVKMLSFDEGFLDGKTCRQNILL